MLSVQTTRSNSVDEGSSPPTGTVKWRNTMRALREKLIPGSASPILPQRDGHLRKTAKDKLLMAQKDLTVSLRYLEDVVQKDKLEMLPGSASIALESVLRLLLTVNECNVSDRTSSVLTSAYHQLYQALANLLRWADRVSARYSDVPARESRDLTALSQLCQELRTATSNLLTIVNEKLDSKQPAERRSLPLPDSLTVNSVSNNNASAQHLSTSMHEPIEPIDGVPLTPREKQLLNEHPHFTYHPEDRANNNATPPPKPARFLPMIPALPPRKQQQAVIKNGHCSPVILHSTLDDSGFRSLNTTNGNDSLASRDDCTMDGLGDGRLFSQKSLDDLLGKCRLDPDEPDGVTFDESMMEKDGNLNTKSVRTTQRTVVKNTQHKTSTVIVRNGADTVQDFQKDFKENVTVKSTQKVSLQGSSQLVVQGSKNSNGHATLANFDSGIDSPECPSPSPPPLPPRRSPPGGTAAEWITHSASYMENNSKLSTQSKLSMVNGKVVEKEDTARYDEKKIGANKQTTLDYQGNVLEVKGGGSYSETSVLKRRKEKLGQEDSLEEYEGSIPPLPPRRRNVVAYVEIFGTPKPVDDAEFRASTLAAYALMRDNLRQHEEAVKHKSMSFNFTAKAPSANENAAAEKAGHSVTINKKLPAPPSVMELAAKEQSNWMALNTDNMQQQLQKVKRDYQNLMDMFEESDEMNFPKRTEIPKSLPPRKVQLALPYVDLTEELDVSNQIIFGAERHEVKGGPLDALIVHATQPSTNQNDFLYQEAFLTTYRTFVTPLELVRKLIRRYSKFCLLDDAIKKRASRNAFSLLIRVVDELSPSETDPEMCASLLELVYKMVSDGELNLSRLLRQKVLEIIENKRLALEHSPTNRFTANLSMQSRPPTLFDFKTEILAEQMTYLDATLFLAIELCEMLYWSQEQAEERSQNLANFTEHFNKISFWVRSRILEQSEAKDRERYAVKFIKIMKHLRKLGNFNSYLAILSALDSGPIRRLDWPKSVFEGLKEHSTLIDSSQSFKQYRLALAEARLPCLPYIGLVLQDLTFVHIGNKNFLPPAVAQRRADVLNFGKRWQQFTILDNIRRFKAWPYEIKPQERVLQFFNNFDDFMSEDTMYQVSEMIKPKSQRFNR